MAVNFDTMRFELAGSYAHLFGQVDPNASLGAFRSGTKCYYEGSLTSNMASVHEAVDTKQINAVPGSPNNNSVLTNAGDYTKAANLKHLFRLALNPLDMGANYVTKSAANDLDTLRNITSADIVALQPGQFAQQRGSIEFNGAAGNEGMVSNGTAEAWGLTNAWTLAGWVRPTSVAAGDAYLWMLTNNTSGVQTGVGSENIIAVIQNGTTLTVRISDAVTTDAQKERVFTGFFALDTWVHISVTWDGSSLLVYKNGALTAPSSIPEDDAVVQANNVRRLIVGGQRPNFADPQGEFTGQIHSLAIWDTALDAPNAGAVAAFGDGAEAPLDHTGTWLLFTTGANAGLIRKIDSHDNTTGVMLFAEAWPFTGTSGDIFRIFSSRKLFNDGPTGAECATGLTDYRALAFLNDTGETLNGMKFYLTPLDRGDVELEIAASDRISWATTAIPSIASDTIEPAVGTEGASEFGSDLQIFRRVVTVDQADFGTPYNDNTALNLTNGVALPIWIKRTIPPQTRLHRSVWLLVAEAASASVSGAGPWRSYLGIVSDPVGFTAVFAFKSDRSPRTFGGSRLEATLKDISGAAVEGVDIIFEKTAGVGALVDAAPVTKSTDAEGFASAIYKASDNEADAGSTVSFTAEFEA